MTTYVPQSGTKLTPLNRSKLNMIMFVGQFNLQDTLYVTNLVLKNGKKESIN